MFLRLDLYCKTPKYIKYSVHRNVCRRRERKSTQRRHKLQKITLSSASLSAYIIANCYPASGYLGKHRMQGVSAFSGVFIHHSIICMSLYSASLWMCKQSIYISAAPQFLPGAGFRKSFRKTPRIYLHMALIVEADLHTKFKHLYEKH